MCQSKVQIPFNVLNRTFGVEIEGYMNEDLRDGSYSGWEFKHDGSLEDEGGTCRRCDGDGYKYESCDECGGEHKISCEECEDGHIDCEYCDGTGEHYDEEAEEYFSCDECGGDGYVECSDCEGRGYTYCDYCDDDGEVKVDCSDCNGSGSLYGNRYGIECVSEVLTLKDGEGLSSISRIFDYIESYDWEVDSSAGTHIHVGAEDLSGYDMAKLTLLIHSLEPVIYGMNQGRYHNGFCKRITNGMVHTILKLTDIENLTQREFFELWRNETNSDRYFGLNFTAYRRHQTVEFRYFMGSDSKEEVKAWAEMVVKLVELSKHTTFEQVLSIIGEIERVNEFSDKVDLMSDLLDMGYGFEWKSGSDYWNCLEYKHKIINVSVDTNEEAS